VEVHEAELPKASVAVLVTVVVPIENVLPEAGVLATVTGPQLSVAAGGEMLTTAPAALVNSVVIGAGQEIVGGVLSTTVTVALHWLEAPLLSVTVRTTAVVPRTNGPAGLKLNVIGSPSGSEEPALTSPGVAVARHVGPAIFVTFLHLATGGLLPAEAKMANGESEVTLPQTILLAVFTGRVVTSFQTRTPPCNSAWKRAGVVPGGKVTPA
jgi:hypothetical protein